MAYAQMLPKRSAHRTLAQAWKKQGLSEVRAVLPVGRIGGLGLRQQVKVTRFAGSPSLLDPLPSPYPLTLSFRVFGA